jgi:hypothetical protein
VSLLAGLLVPKRGPDWSAQDAGHPEAAVDSAVAAEGVR